MLPAVPSLLLQLLILSMLISAQPSRQSVKGRHWKCVGSTMKTWVFCGLKSKKLKYLWVAWIGNKITLRLHMKYWANNCCNCVNPGRTLIVSFAWQRCRVHAHDAGAHTEILKVQSVILIGNLIEKRNIVLINKHLLVCNYIFQKLMPSQKLKNLSLKIHMNELWFVDLIMLLRDLGYCGQAGHYCYCAKGEETSFMYRGSKFNFCKQKWTFKKETLTTECCPHHSRVHYCF